jgi:glycolate oxidase FAD binding subunit
MDRSLRPESPQELADLVAACADRDLPLRVLGRSSKAGWGNPVDAPRELSTAALRGIVSYEPAELVMTAWAGTPLSEVEAALAEHGQQLAFEPCPGTPGRAGDEPGGSLGGVFACNLSGPRRLVAGAARDHLLGFEAVGGRGEPFRAGGTVVKNVTGYDLCKLLCGSFGTLAVLTRLNLRVMPVAAERASIALTGLPTPQAFALLRQLAGSAWQLTGLCWLAPGTAPSDLPRDTDCGTVLLRLEGTPRGTRDRLQRLRGTLGEGTLRVLDREHSDRCWRAVRDLDWLTPTADDDALLRVTLPPTAAERLAGLLARYPSCRWLADQAGACCWLRCPADLLSRLGTAVRSLLLEVGGALSLVDGPPRIPAFGPLPRGNAGLNGRIKASLDPAGILNPGLLGVMVHDADPIHA